MGLRASGWVLVLGAVLAGCTSGPPAVPPPPAPPGQPVPVPVPDDDPVLKAFEQQQQARAEQAESAGRWGEAVLAWEVLAAVRPAGPAGQRLVQARQRAASAAAERAGVAEAAQRRGDLDAAAQAWLEVLALDELRPGAAEALRQIERDRNRRSMVGRFAKLSPPRKVSADSDMPVAGSEAARTSNTLREHATVMARQGDFDAATQMLRDSPDWRTDVSLRALAADVYVQKAESLRVRQPAAARAAVDAALAIDPRHPAALQLQQQLGGRGRAPGTGNR